MDILQDLIDKGYINDETMEQIKKHNTRLRRSGVLTVREQIESIESQLVDAQLALCEIYENIGE